ncbi:MAG: DMT family transporter [Granulosicoccus sp.]
MKPDFSHARNRLGNNSTLREPLLLDYLRLLCASAIWGATFLCNEIALVDFSPAAIAAYRIIIAALLLLIICYWRGQRLPLDRATLGWLALIGLLNSVLPFTLIGWGQIRIDSATTGILLASSPFATLLMSHMLTRDDRFAWNRFFGLVLGFSGVCVLLGQGLQEGEGSFTGMLAVVMAGCCYSLSSILIRRLESVPSLVLAAGTLLIAGAILLPFLLLVETPWQQAYRSSTLFAVLFLALGPTAIGYVLRAQIVKLNGAVFMSNVGYLIPLFAVFWGWVFLSHQPDSAMISALCLILAGIAAGQNRFATLVRKVRSRP